MHKIKNKNGYTLIETLIALIVFVGVVVPLLAVLFGARNQNRAQDMVTAACILEQEAKKAQVMPDPPPPLITRKINNIDWKIRWEVSNDPLQRCIAKLYKRDQFITDAAVYRYVIKK
jgi:type II secretory pathway pseudopilin PulG